MRPALGSVLAVVLLLGLGALAVFALASPAAPPPQPAPTPEPAVAPDSASDTAGSVKWTDLAVPLEVNVDGPDTGTANNADEVAAYIVASCPAAQPCPGAIPRLSHYKNDTQAWETHEVGTGADSTNFAIGLGDAFFVAADAALTAPTLSWVGGVPASGSIHYNVGANRWTALMVPLDRSIDGAPAKADDLAAAIGRGGTGVTKVAQWREDTQTWEIREVGTLYGGDNFPVQIGYPYLVYSTVAYTWP